MVFFRRKQDAVQERHTVGLLPLVGWNGQRSARFSPAQEPSSQVEVRSSRVESSRVVSSISLARLSVPRPGL